MNDATWPAQYVDSAEDRPDELWGHAFAPLGPNLSLHPAAPTERKSEPVLDVHSHLFFDELLAAAGPTTSGACSKPVNASRSSTSRSSPPAR
ncbi:hypothetical protein PV733_15795 [Streptomyces europaeiscabiei]|uniref:hypothetical protein n=1 Tax=Streptomyces europaeiscabiei TaxID=146819 RepID=UPI0029B2C5F1|nr:hypothetical protein [Streptomyces europaeiscabiei]MDX3710395.1 hypothetical protein [Streptomyces europaeiscabiei]